MSSQDSKKITPHIIALCFLAVIIVFITVVIVGQFYEPVATPVFWLLLITFAIPFISVIIALIFKIKENSD